MRVLGRFPPNAGTIGMRALGDRFVALLLSLGLIAALVTSARAGPYEDALLRFTADSFGETIEGINEVVASGNPLAATVVGALQEGRLLFSAQSKRVFIKDPSDRLIDAATGQPVAGSAPADLAPVRLNNRLRGIVQATLGSLTLTMPLSMNSKDEDESPAVMSFEEPSVKFTSRLSEDLTIERNCASVTLGNESISSPAVPIAIASGALRHEIDEVVVPPEVALRTEVVGRVRPVVRHEHAG